MEEREETSCDRKDEYVPPAVVDYGLLAKQAEAASGTGTDGYSFS